MTVSTCRTGDRTSQRVSALERELVELRAQLGRWQRFEPPLWAIGQTPWLDVEMGGGASRMGSYIRIGNRLDLHYTFTWGSPPWDGHIGAIATMLPPGITAAPGGNQYFHAHLWTTSGTEGTMDWAGSAFVLPSAEFIQLLFPRWSGDCRLAPYTIAGPTPGSRDWSVPFIGTGYPEGGVLSLEGTLDIA